jgi:radical SAM superfamily enzyme YgiQ (UPF0313 family)
MVKKAFDICKRVGVKTSSMFMIGLPTETNEEVMQTAKLIDELDAFTKICTIYRPYPGSELYDYCIENELVKLPERLEDHGNLFNIGTTDINVSNADTELLTSIQKRINAGNKKKELMHALKHINFGYIYYSAKRLRKIN